MSSMHAVNPQRHLLDSKHEFLHALRQKIGCTTHHGYPPTSKVSEYTFNPSCLPAFLTVHCTQHNTAHCFYYSSDANVI